MSSLSPKRNEFFAENETPRESRSSAERASCQSRTTTKKISNFEQELVGKNLKIFQNISSSQIPAELNKTEELEYVLNHNDPLFGKLKKLENSIFQPSTQKEFFSQTEIFKVNKRTLIEDYFLKIEKNSEFENQLKTCKNLLKVKESIANKHFQGLKPITQQSLKSQIQKVESSNINLKNCLKKIKEEKSKLEITNKKIINVMLNQELKLSNRIEELKSLKLKLKFETKKNIKLTQELISLKQTIEESEEIIQRVNCADMINKTKLQLYEHFHSILWSQVLEEHPRREELGEIEANSLLAFDIFLKYFLVKGELKSTIARSVSDNSFDEVESAMMNAERKVEEEGIGPFPYTKIEEVMSLNFDEEKKEELSEQEEEKEYFKEDEEGFSTPVRRKNFSCKKKPSYCSSSGDKKENINNSNFEVREKEKVSSKKRVFEKLANDKKFKLRMVKKTTLNEKKLLDSLEDQFSPQADSLLKSLKILKLVQTEFQALKHLLANDPEKAISKALALPQKEFLDLTSSKNLSTSPKKKVKFEMKEKLSRNEIKIKKLLSKLDFLTQDITNKDCMEDLNELYKMVKIADVILELRRALKKSGVVDKKVLGDFQQLWKFLKLIKKIAKSCDIKGIVQTRKDLIS